MATWYRTGTISVANGSATVTGQGTAFVGNVAAGMMVVHQMRIIGEVQAVVSDTELTLAEAYAGTAITSDDYAVANLGSVRVGLLGEVQSLISSVNGHLGGALSGRFQDGDAAEPGVAFADEIGLGLYRRTPGVIAATDRFEAPEYRGDGVQADTGDDTAGRLLRAGAGGILGTAPRQHDKGWNSFDQMTVGGMWSLGITDLADGPLGAAATNYNGTCLVMQRDFSTGESITQLVNQSGNLYFRSGSYDPMSWNPWRKILDEDNFGEIGENANGWYQRMPSGLQVCVSPDFTGVDVNSATGSLYRTASPISWSYPATFAGGVDTVSGSVTSMGNSETHFGSFRVTGQSSAEISVFGPASVTGRTVRAMAVGLWK